MRRILIILILLNQILVFGQEKGKLFHPHIKAKVVGEYESPSTELIKEKRITKIKRKNESNDVSTDIYNKDGFAIEWQEHDTLKNFRSSTIFDRNENGSILNLFKINSKKDTTLEEKNLYNDSDLLISSQTGKSTTIYSYDNEGKLINVRLECNDTLTSMRYLIYNLNGKLIKDSTNLNEGNYHFQTKYKYYANGLLMEEVNNTEYSSGNSSDKSRFEYDTIKNILTEFLYLRGELWTVTKTKFKVKSIRTKSKMADGKFEISSVRKINKLGYIVKYKNYFRDWKKMYGFKKLFRKKVPNSFCSFHPPRVIKHKFKYNSNNRLVRKKLNFGWNIRPISKSKIYYQNGIKNYMIEFRRQKSIFAKRSKSISNYSYEFYPL